MTFDVNHPLLADLTPEGKVKVLDTTFPAMVDELAKPGETIRSELTFERFVRLLQVLVPIINKGNELDVVKKQTIYNKDVPLPEQLRLPSSAGLSVAHEELTAEKAHLLHMAIGLAGEAAEMLEQVVAHVLGSALDGENVREEAGDSIFYIVGLLNAIHTPLEEAQFANKVKLLGKRYANGYSDKAAQDRADKVEGQ